MAILRPDYIFLVVFVIPSTLLMSGLLKYMIETYEYYLIK